MTHSRKYGLFFATGIGCIALGYSLWMYINSNLPAFDPLILFPTIFAPSASFAIAAGSWIILTEKMKRRGWAAGALIGVLAGWTTLSSGLLIHFLIGAGISEEPLQSVDDLFMLFNVVFVAGPLLLFMLWGWIPVLMCIILGALGIPYSYSKIDQKSEG